VSQLLRAQTVERPHLRELVVWIAEHPGGDLSVEALAMRSNMSVRNFSRAFQRAAGNTPARLVETVRVENARRLLEDTDMSIQEIARTCGLGNANSMRRAFLRVLGTAPGDYRRRLREA